MGDDGRTGDYKGGQQFYDEFAVHEGADGPADDDDPQPADAQCRAEAVAAGAGQALRGGWAGYVRADPDVRPRLARRA